jgi:hypothetical protein
MKVVIRVENHQPVPLVPFVELQGIAWKGAVVVYMGIRRWKNGYEGEELTTDAGWYIWDGDTFTRVESGWTFDMDDFDEERTLGRLLQPGERLCVTYENL